ncbi:MAG TPA: HAMP domain-containing protein, partial [Burkholderiales bacterium]|nr:HAMP domain-containing protein [Burkholderiales bacterium]
AGTVMLATYLLVERYSRPLQLLRESMEEIGYGRFDVRIAEQRNDEIGELFRQFDAMAASLEERSRGDAVPARKPTHAVTRAEAGGSHA